MCTFGRKSLVLIALGVALASGCMAGPAPDDLSTEPYDEEEVVEGEATLIASSGPSGTGTTGTITTLTCTGTYCWCLPGNDRPGASCDEFELLCTRLSRTIRCCRFFATGAVCENRYNAFADYCSCS
jgi:hypothetical protein